MLLYACVFLITVCLSMIPVISSSYYFKLSTVVEKYPLNSIDCSKKEEEKGKRFTKSFLWQLHSINRC